MNRDVLRWTMLATHVPAGGSLGGVVRYTTELMRALAARDDVELSAVANAAAADTVGEIIGDRDRVSTVPNLATPAMALVERHLPLPIDGVDVVQGAKHLVPRRTSAFTVLTVHDMLLLDRPDDFGRVKRGLLPGPYRASIRDADLVVCVSEATRERLRAFVPEALHHASVVPLATSSTLRDATPLELAALHDDDFALVVGDSSPRKNLRTLVSAWPAVRAARPGAVLAIAGPPSWGRSEVGELYESLVADGAIAPLGYVSDAQLRWAYEHASVVLCPSLAEGFGLPAAEAMQFGAPVIVSDDAALREVVAGDAAGVVAATDTARWATAVGDAFANPHRVTGHASRTWADVADDTVEAVRRRLAGDTSHLLAG